MRFVWLACLVCVIAVGGAVAPWQSPSVAGAADTPARRVTVATLPLRFEANLGQFRDDVRFVARDRGMTLFLSDDAATIALRDQRARSGGATLSMRVVGAAARRPSGVGPLPTRTSYFVGGDPAKWRAGVPSFRRARYTSVLPGVDVEYHGDGGRLEFDFVVAAGASLADLSLQIDGADGLAIANDGSLEVRTQSGLVTQPAPRAYQDAGGEQHDVAVSYELLSANRIGFHAAQRDESAALVIDPVLAYSTYVGGSLLDDATGAAADGTGNAYIAGYTASTDFPTRNPLQASSGGGANDAFVAKIDPTGSLVYATYLGGADDDGAQAIAVDGAGNAYVTGYTLSTNFPTANALQPMNATKANCVSSGDAFVAKLDPAGATLVYSTYLGGSCQDQAWGIALDGSNDVYVAGWTTSSDYPTKNPVQASVSGAFGDAFLTKIASTGASLDYSTYLGGSGLDFARGVAVDGSGNAYLVGYTASANFPTRQPIQAAYAGGTFYGDAFVAKFDATGSALVYSTYLGGSNDDLAEAVAVDGAGVAHVSGFTESTNFPTANAMQGSYGGGPGDGFVAAIDAGGSAFAYCTYLGGTGDDNALGIAVKATGEATVVGFTDSTNFTTVNPVQAQYGGGFNDAFVSTFDASGATFTFSTFLGGSGIDSANAVALDGAGNVHVAGETASTDFPTVQPVQASYGGGMWDGFVASIGMFGMVDGGAPDGGGAPDAAADSGADATADSGADAVADTGADAVADAGGDAGADSGHDAAAESGADAAAGPDTGADAMPVADGASGADAAEDAPSQGPAGNSGGCGCEVIARDGSAEHESWLAATVVVGIALAARRRRARVDA